MKIGLIVVGYQCEKYVHSVLAPWLLLKWGDRDSGLAPNPDLDIKIVVVSALFKEYAELFNLTYDNEPTAAILKEYEKSKAIEKYIEIKENIFDYQSRVAGWNFLKQFNVDYLWQLDCDELYNSEQILKTIDFIKRNEFVDFFRINFKNYIGDIKAREYVKDFAPVRIINNRKHGEVDTFFFDNDVVFNNKIRTPSCVGLTIPFNICSPEHYSWCYDNTEESKQKIKNKIRYQIEALPSHLCSYVWDNGLKFNKDYYKTISEPIIYKD